MQRVTNMQNTSQVMEELEKEYLGTFCPKNQGIYKNEYGYIDIYGERVFDFHKNISEWWLDKLHKAITEERAELVKKFEAVKKEEWDKSDKSKWGEEYTALYEMAMQKRNQTVDYLVKITLSNE